MIFKKAILIVMQIYFTLPILSCRGRSAPKMEKWEIQLFKNLETFSRNNLGNK